MFEQIRAQVLAKYNEIVKTGQLYIVDLDKQTIWDTYLNAFSDETRQSHNCNCCKSFIRQYAGIVGIKDNVRISMWDLDAVDPEYQASVLAMREYIHSLPILGIFMETHSTCGTAQNWDDKRLLTWQHYSINLPANAVMRDFGPKVASALDDKNVLQRSLEEITPDAVDTVLELIKQNSLYKGNEWLVNIEAFRKLQKEYKLLKNKQHKEHFAWNKSRISSVAVNRMRNTAIGTLLNDLSIGTELDAAVRSYERVVAPANYKRPTALVTPKMVENAKQRLTELDLVGSLDRRLMSINDLTVNNALYVYRPSAKTTMDIFDTMKADVTVNPKTLSKVEEISIQDFVTNVLPSSKNVRALVENSHMGNFVTLVGPKNPDDKSMFKWDNNVSWSYSGEVADSIKERVKNAGGKVDGVLRISLSWHNHDDLDLHLIDPTDDRVYYGNKIGKCGATLDVDMNAGMGTTRTPVENIVWSQLPKKEGRYKVIVNNFNRRESADTGFELEIEWQGELYHFAHKNNGTSKSNFTVVQFDYTRANGVVFVGKVESNSGYASKQKWGVKTGQFHKVNAITISPNHWTNTVGNKHFMFFLEGCKTDEKVRPFYNEFLSPDLDKDRKVFEILAGKITVEPVENELSGLGFSDTQRNSIYVEVEGAFKRILKVKF